MRAFHWGWNYMFWDIFLSHTDPFLSFAMKFSWSPPTHGILVWRYVVTLHAAIGHLMKSSCVKWICWVNANKMKNCRSSVFGASSTDGGLCFLSARTWKRRWSHKDRTKENFIGSSLDLTKTLWKCNVQPISPSSCLTTFPRRDHKHSAIRST